jgi:hypothetical protein
MRPPLHVGDQVRVVKVPEDDYWLCGLVGKIGIVIERGRQEVRGYLHPPVYVVIKLGIGVEIALLESECELEDGGARQGAFQGAIPASGPAGAVAQSA